MQAVILAAGRAQRLGPASEGSPKCLLEIGGRALIEYSLDNLARAGVSGFTIVTGYRDGAIQQALGTRHLGLPIRYLFNPHYERTGSVVSLCLGAAEIASSNLLVVEADILYHPRFIAAAVASPDDTMMVADASGSGDEVFVCRGMGDRLAYLGKDAPPKLRENSLGEYAGIARLSAGLCRAYREQVESLVKTGRAEGHYEDLIFSLAQAGHEVRVCHCPSLPWTEVDTVHDLDQARNEVYPKLRHFWEAEPRTAAGLRRAG